MDDIDTPDTLAPDPFSSLRAAAHIAPGAAPARLDWPALARLFQQAPQGLLLTAWQVDSGSDLHSHLWEVHADGDELLFMLSGAVSIECADGARRSRSELRPGQGVTIPQGVWHRLDLLEPGLLLALSPTPGTRLADQPE